MIDLMIDLWKTLVICAEFFFNACLIVSISNMTPCAQTFIDTKKHEMNLSEFPALKILC